MNDNYRQTTAAAYNHFPETYRRENEESENNVMGEKFKGRLRHLLQLAEWDSLRDKSVLEVGFGTGRDITEFIQAEMNTYLGLDLSDEMLTIAASRYPQFNFIKADFYDFDYPQNQFDVLWASAALLHLTPEDAVAVLEKIYDALKFGAVGMISMRVRQGRDDKDPGILISNKQGQEVQRYFAFYSIEEFRQLVQTSGLEVIDVTSEMDVTEQSEWMYIYVAKF